MKLPVGSDVLNVSKRYYKSTSEKVFVDYIQSRNSITVRLVATGRQVPVAVINKITGKPVADAELKVLDSEARTDSDGKAIIVLPLGVPVRNGVISASGYNNATISVQVTSQAIAANTFTLTPAGSVYFLSNLSGKIDVVKTNLDGSNRKTVLAGTGYETPYNTVLLASRDWKYLALFAQRSKTGNPELDLIDTSTDTMSNIDEGNATFTLVGWDGDRFIYQVNRTTVQPWQNGQQALKSFDAATKKITVLAQTSAVMNNDHVNYGNQYCAQSFGNTYILDGKVVYTLNWVKTDGGDFGWYIYICLLGKQATISAVNADGSGNVLLKGFPYPSGAGTPYYNLTITAVPYDTPSSLVLSYTLGNTKPVYYEYANGKVSAATSITDQTFYKSYPTYLLSPSGEHTFWSVPADGKNTLNVGDKEGGGANKIAILSDYSPYGWYTDDYLLVSKNGSELYIMPASGGAPLLISNYYKPSQFFSGYGGGYGGL